jgi:hypothetical protein
MNIPCFLSKLLFAGTLKKCTVVRMYLFVYRPAISSILLISGFAKLVSNRGQDCTVSLDMNKCKTINAANFSLPGVMASETNVK